MSIVCKNSSNQTIEKLYQWDINYDIYISGIDMSSTPLFHFCNRRSKCAYVVAPVADNGRLKATIPNALLAEPYTIFLYLYYNGACDSGRTVYVVSFPVVPRQRPQNYTAVDNYISVDMIDQSIVEYIAEAAEQISDNLVSRVTALEASTGDMSDELIDIRNGYDGTTYESAGDAVRALGAAVDAIDPVPNVHPFASQTDYNNNIDPIYSGDFIVITTGTSGEKKLMFKQKDGTVTTLVTTEGFYKMPVDGIPLTALSDEVQALITGDGDSDITINDGYRTYGFASTTAYETFISDYPDVIKDDDYIWINESTPTKKRYTLYRWNSSLPDGKDTVFTINNTLYITVSIENNELVADANLAQIRTALAQNRDLALITETGVSIELSDIKYGGGVASEVQFTAVTFNDVCHILTTYIINSSGLTVKYQNLTLAGIKYISVGITGSDYDIAYIPDIFTGFSDIVDAAGAGADIRITVAHDVGRRLQSHPLIEIYPTVRKLVFAGIETIDSNTQGTPVLAVYSISQSDEHVIREEYHIDNDLVPSGSGSGGVKTTWYGSCSTASSTAAKTVSLTGYTLDAGSIVNIKFTNAVNANATLNINSTGAISIYNHGTAINSGIIGAGATALMVYDGSHYCLIGTDYGYIKPNSGIPLTDLAQTVQASIDLGRKLVVTYTALSSTSDVTPSDIYAALSSGYKIVLHESDMGEYEIPLSFVNSSGTVAVFSGVIRDYSTGNIKSVAYYIESQGATTKTVSSGGSSIIPTPTAADAGKVPMVNSSGIVEWVEIPVVDEEDY